MFCTPVRSIGMVALRLKTIIEASCISDQNVHFGAVGECLDRNHAGSIRWYNPHPSLACQSVRSRQGGESYGRCLG